jgi:hypothetical protein
MAQARHPSGKDERTCPSLRVRHTRCRPGQDDNDTWEDLTAQAAYNTSASFLAWLLDTYGAGKLRQIYAAPSHEFMNRVNSVYGRPLESLEADWLRFCDTWVG